MPYEAQISRSSPTAFLFVVDQSGSMSDKMASGKSKAEFVADALNRILMDLMAAVVRPEACDTISMSEYSGTVAAGSAMVSPGRSVRMSSTLFLQ